MNKNPSMSQRANGKWGGICQRARLGGILAGKELNEDLVWLSILVISGTKSKERFQKLRSVGDELCRIISASSSKRQVWISISEFRYQNSKALPHGIRPEGGAFERRGWDSNPRYPCEYAAFRVRCFQPLSHLSGVQKRGPQRQASYRAPQRHASCDS